MIPSDATSSGIRVWHIASSASVAPAAKHARSPDRQNLPGLVMETLNRRFAERIWSQAAQTRGVDAL